MSNSFIESLKSKKTLIGMIHLSALPGTPKNNKDNKEIIKIALNEAAIYRKAGIQTVAIENMHDVPYINKKAGHEISSLMSIIGYEIKQKLNLYCGIQILAAANKQALAAAHSAGLDFIRAEGFVFGHLADEGFIDSDAAELLRYRKLIGAENIAVFTDIKKKHSSHAITSDVSLAETAKAAEFFLSDGVIVTGSATGEETDLDQLKTVRGSTKLPVIIGSGITSQNIIKYLDFADGFIVGSFFKKAGNWQNPLDIKRIDSLVDKFK